MLKTIIPLLFAATATGAPTSPAAACDRTALEAVTDSYIAAQGAGDSTKLSALASTSTYTENFKAATVSTGILAQALKIDHNASLHDTTACATYTELIVTDSKHPYVIGSQIWLDSATLKVAKMETIVTDKGDWLFDAASTLKWASQEKWDVIPVEKRDSREAIKAAADAYADLFNDKTVVVPWGTPCARLEGGSYTGNGGPNDRCDVGVPSGVKNTNRRYVIDETRGSVDMFFTFGESLPDSHEFRLEGGKLRYVHTLTVMGS